MVRPHLVTEDDALTPEDIEWTRATLATLKNGGAWIVPRSGVSVTKHSDTLYTVGYMPFWGYTVKVEAFPDEEPNAD